MGLKVLDLLRGCQNGAVILNGKKVAWSDPGEYPITSLVLFPKRPVTLF